MIPIKFVPAELQASRVLIGQLGQYISHGMSLLRGMKIMSRDTIVDLTGVLSCRATSFECLRHNLLSLQQVSSM